MTQGNYVSEDTNSLIRRAQQTMGNIPILDLTNWQSPTYLPAGTTQMRSLSPNCHSITVKNVITVTNSSIVMCTAGGAPTNVICPIPGSCPTGPLSPSDYVNIVATINAGVAQSGVDITFKYVLDDTPTTTVKTVALTAGANTIYAFDTSIQYPSDTTLVLYGAEVTKY
jgi:hypothetical protein